MPEATSTDCEEASTVAANVRFGYSGTVSCALVPILIAGHVVLRHVDIDAQLGGVGDDEHRRPAAAAGIDQRADVGGARGDQPVERRDDALVFLKHSQAVEIGLGGLDGRPCLLARSAVRWSRSCFETAPEVISVLRRAQGLPRTARALACCAGEIGAGLHDLLVEIGRVDLGEQLACLHLGVPMSAFQSFR